MSEELRARAHDVLAQHMSSPGNPRVGEAVDAMLSFASSAAGQREGWKLVPVEVTESMCTAAVRELANQSLLLGWDPSSIWSAMLAASPSAPEERRDEVERDVLAAFVAALTGNGRNSDRCLSINHDELAGLVTRARAALTPVSQGAAPEERRDEVDFPREKIARICLDALFGFQYTGESLCDEADRIFSSPNPRAARAVALADRIAAALTPVPGER